MHTLPTDPRRPSSAPTFPDATARVSIDLDITGMTCASCAARVEKKLNKVPGVTASVNYATNRAHVLAPPGTAPDSLIPVVEATGQAFASGNGAMPRMSAWKYSMVPTSNGTRPRARIAAILSSASRRKRPAE